MRRRDFLRTGTAAAGLPAFAASPKIRAAVIGTGHAHASAKVKALQDSAEFELAGVFEPDAEARGEAERTAAYRNVRWLAQAEALAADIQMVAVETTVPDLLGWAREAIAAGKHVHVDKAPGHRLEPFREVVEEARRKNLLLQTGYVWRFHPAVQAAFAAARQGWLGDVYLIRGVINTDLEPERRIPLARYRGGMMFELGGHLIDRIVDLWGRPREVHAFLRHHNQYADRLADNTLAVLEYDRGMAEVSSSCRTPGSFQHRSFELIGTNGAAVIQPIEPGRVLHINLREPQGPYRAGWQDVEMPAAERYGPDFQAMARALAAKAPLHYSYDYELLLQETLLRASGEL